MKINIKRQILENVAKMLRKEWGDLGLSIMEIGAAPHEGVDANISLLKSVFPDSKIAAFELDPELCNELNNQAQPGVTYYPVPLGRRREDRLLFEAEHPMCTSLYRPNDVFADKFTALDVMRFKKVSSVATVDLDSFAQASKLGPIDFINIDVQGAELEIFEGGETLLQEVSLIHTEVEFVQMYHKQPLFGDVCSFLTKQGFMFHKFSGISGRTMSPVVLNKDICFATQHLWANAIFIRDLMELERLKDIKLLKIGLLMLVYGSQDVSYQCFEIVGRRNGIDIAGQLLAILNQPIQADTTPHDTVA